MRPITLLAVACAPLALSGCFTAEQAWLTDANSVAPYQTITFQESDSTDVNVLNRAGSAYLYSDDDVTLAMRFMPLPGRTDWYVVEVSGEDEGDIARLYAVLKVDLTAMTGSTYLAVAGEDDTGPGLRECEDMMVCIDDLEAYVAHATAAIDAGAEPVAVYAITVQ